MFSRINRTFCALRSLAMPHDLLAAQLIYVIDMSQFSRDQKRDICLRLVSCVNLLIKGGRANTDAKSFDEKSAIPSKM